MQRAGLRRHGHFSFGRLVGGSALTASLARSVDWRAGGGLHTLGDRDTSRDAVRYVFSTLLTLTLLTSVACSGGPDASGDPSAQSSDTAKQGSGKAAAAPKDGIIGRWRDDSSNPILHSTITIYAQGGHLYLENKFDDGSVRKLKLIEKDSPLGRRFDPVPEFRLGDHWVVDSNGDLLLRDSQGTATKAKKIE